MSLLCIASRLWPSTAPSRPVCDVVSVRVVRQIGATGTSAARSYGICPEDCQHRALSLCVAAVRARHSTALFAERAIRTNMPKAAIHITYADVGTLRRT